MTGEMEALEPRRIGDREHVLGHRLDRQGGRPERAAANAAVVRRDDGVAIAKSVELRPPSFAYQADALDQHHGRAAPFTPVPQDGAADLERLHSSSIVKTAAIAKR